MDRIPAREFQFARQAEMRSASGQERRCAGGAGCRTGLRARAVPAGNGIHGVRSHRTGGDPATPTAVDGVIRPRRTGFERGRSRGDGARIRAAHQAASALQLDCSSAAADGSWERPYSCAGSATCWQQADRSAWLPPLTAAGRQGAGGAVDGCPVVRDHARSVDHIRARSLCLSGAGSITGIGAPGS